jgi:hydrogenase-4 component F
MNAIYAIVGVPAAAALLLAAVPAYRWAAGINVAASGLTLLAGLSLFVVRPAPNAYVFIDNFNVYMVALTSFVGFTASLFSHGYIARELASGHLDPPRVRFYHAAYQAFLASMLLALCANNLGLLWVAIEAATLSTVSAVSLYGTREAIAAAWKYFIICSVGIALALFGTILVYLAAQPAMGAGLDAMAWTALIANAAKFDPALMSLAFVFLLIGYGTKVGLVPLHAWLPDAHAEGPTPISAVLSGLLLNVALYAVLRFKMLIADGAAMPVSPGALMIGMGLASLLFASVMLYRRRDIKRLFAYSSIEHMGVMAFAFGLGGPLANFAGLLHMTMHSLAKSAIFYIVGHIAQAKGTQRIAAIRGLTASHPALGWSLVAGVAALAGLPPLGIFMSQFLLVTATIANQPLLALPLVLGLALSLGALLLRLQQLAFGESHGTDAPLPASLAPVYAHLALVVVAGIYLPPPVVTWFQHVAKLLG